MAADAVWTLRDVCRRDGNQLLGLGRQRALGKNPGAEVSEGLVNPWRKLLARRSDLLCRLGIDLRHLPALLFRAHTQTSSLQTICKRQELELDIDYANAWRIPRRRELFNPAFRRLAAATVPARRRR